MMRFRSQHAVLGMVVVGSVLMGLVWMLFQPATSLVKKRDRLAIAELQHRLERPPRVERGRSSIRGGGPSRPSEPEPERFVLSEEWRDMRGEILTTLHFGMPPMPRAGARRGVVDDYLTRTRERRNLLSALEVELVDAIEKEVEPYSRLDAEVALAELYLSQATLFDRTWIPDHFSDRRAAKIANRLEKRAVVSRDKADLLMGIAQTEAANLAGLPTDDPVSLRLQSLLNGAEDGG